MVNIVGHLQATILSGHGHSQLTSQASNYMGGVVLLHLCFPAPQFGQHLTCEGSFSSKNLFRLGFQPHIIEQVLDHVSGA